MLHWSLGGTQVMCFLENEGVAAADVGKIWIYEATKPRKIASVKRSRPPPTLLNCAPAVCRLCHGGWRFLQSEREKKKKQQSFLFFLFFPPRSLTLRGCFVLHLNCWHCENLRSDPIPIRRGSACEWFVTSREVVSQYFLSEGWGGGKKKKNVFDELEN